METEEKLGFETIRRNLHLVLRNWHRPEIDESDAFAGFVLLRLESHKHPLSSTERRERLHKVVEDCIEDLGQQNPRHRLILTQRFQNMRTTQQIAVGQHLSPDQINRIQGEAIAALAGHFLDKESSIRRVVAQRMENRLPPKSYALLFGFEPIEEKLDKFLSSSGEPWVVAVTGLGGSGKTALVDAAARKAISKFIYTNILWLPAEDPQQPTPTANFLAQMAKALLPANTPSENWKSELRDLLKTEPHLIVFDDVEANAQESEWSYLLNDLANPSRFLLTSRGSISAPANAYVVKTPELGLEAASALLTHTMERIGMTNRNGELSAQAASIYARTGGHPMAINLTAGLLQDLPLKAIFSLFDQRENPGIDKIFKEIYQSSWRALDRNARLLLEGFVHSKDLVASFDQLRDISKISEVEVAKAVNQLVSHSLLEVSWPTAEPIYSMRPITAVFLRSGRTDLF